MTVSITDVRQFLRDQPEFNILLAAKEFTDDDITKAMEFAISEYNAMTPITTTELSAFPNDWLLLLGTTAHLLRSAAHLYARNHVSFQDGDTNLQMDDKSQEYRQIADEHMRSWKTAAQKFKQARNMENGYGSLSSGYSYIWPGRRW